MTFPAFVPSSRTWSPGAYPATAWTAISGSEARVRHSTVLVDSELRLTFLAISEAAMLALLAHYLQVIGTWTTFTLPSAVWSGVATPSDYLLAGYAWRYSGPPEVRDLACGGHDVTVALRSVVPEASVAPGADLVVPVRILTSSPVIARGATLTVQALIASGGAVGVTSNVAPGATLSVAASIAGGSASTDTGAGAALTVAASIAGGSAGVTDPDFSSVKLLLHMNGSNNSTTITDSSGTPKTVTAISGAKISTAESKYGGASLLLNGTTDYAETAANSALYLNDTDYTVECWLYSTRAPGTANAGTLQAALTQGDGAWLGFANEHNWIALFQSAVVTFGKFPNFYEATYTLPQNQWVHFAAVGNSSGSITVYMDGTSLGTQTGRTALGSATWATRIGRSFHGDTKVGNYFKGYIDDVRITKGLAPRYTANFTPPSAPFPDS